jgi:hypothetical protein
MNGEQHIMQYDTSTEHGEDRRETHGISRDDLGPVASELGLISGPIYGDRAVLAAEGAVHGDVADALAAALRDLDPGEAPLLTLDLRRASSLDPLIIHALMHAWERRGRQWGCVRLLVSPGPVQQYLDRLGLDHAFDLVHPGELAELPRNGDPQKWRQALAESLLHYRRLLQAIDATDAGELRLVAAQAHPVCIAAGAAQGGTAFGKWCQDCPLRKDYGGCQPVIAQILRSASLKDWESARRLVLALIAQVEGLHRRMLATTPPNDSPTPPADEDDPPGDMDDHDGETIHVGIGNPTCRERPGGDGLRNAGARTISIRTARAAPNARGCEPGRTVHAQGG